MFYRYEHYMSISHMALIVAIVHLALINKKRKSYSGFCRTSKIQRGSEGRWETGQILSSCQRIEKVIEHEGDGNTSSSGSLWNSPQEPGKVTEN